MARGDRQDRVAVLGTEPTQHVEDLARLAHRLADIAESIGELLEAPGVLGDVHVALHQIAELRLEVHGAMQFVVAKLLADGLPDAVRRSLGCVDDVAHVLGDGDIEPADDALVDDDLVRVVALLRGRRR